MKISTSNRRKLAIATWRSPQEANIYGKLSLDASNALKYIEELREKTGKRITLTHLIGRIAGHVLAQAPTLNGRIFLGNFIPHKTVDVSFLVAIDEGRDLGKFKVKDANLKTTEKIADELLVGSGRIRTGVDSSQNAINKWLDWLPTWVVRPMLWLSGYLTGAAGISLPPFKLEAFPFGACIITSVGMFDMDEAFAPPTPFARVPIYLVVPSVRKKAVVIDEQIVIRPILDLTATLDHRFVDGAQAAMLAKIFRKAFADPWSIDLNDANLG